MASGSEDYWMTKSRFIGSILDNIFSGLGTGGDLLDALDALDGTMDGKLTLSELNTSSVKTNLDTSNTKLQTSIDKLILAITQLTGIHSDTTDMIAYSSEDTSGSSIQSVVSLISSENVTRNLLKITNTSGESAGVSREDPYNQIGTISGGSDSTFFGAEGVWLKGLSGAISWTAHEEWAT